MDVKDLVIGETYFDHDGDICELVSIRNGKGVDVRYVHTPSIGRAPLINREISYSSSTYLDRRLTKLDKAIRGIGEDNDTM